MTYNPADSSVPTVVFTQGLPAAGKSTTVARLFPVPPWTVIDPDAVKAMHPEYDPANPQALHAWSKAITDRQYSEALASSEGCWVVDGTGTSAGKLIRRMERARAAGFRVVLLYVRCSLATSLARNAARDRVVPPAVVRRKATEIAAAHKDAAPHADHVVTIDTEDPRTGPGRDPRDKGYTPARVAAVKVRAVARCETHGIDPFAPVRSTATMRDAADTYLPGMGGGSWLATAPAWEVLAVVRWTPTGRIRALFGSSAKVEKGLPYGVLTAVQYLAPASRSGVNVCPWAGNCAALCLGFTSGHLRFNTAHRAGVLRAWHRHLFRASYDAQYRHEVAAHEGKAAKLGVEAAIRPNGSSDLHDFVDCGVRSYDYTKAPVSRYLLRQREAGRHLTYSLDGLDMLGRAAAWQAHGVNVAIVVRTKADAAWLLDRGSWLGRAVVDGDAHDIRYHDPEVGGWVVLYAKGPAAKRDASGFVLDRADLLTAEDRHATYGAGVDSADRAAATREGRAYVSAAA